MTTHTPGPWEIVTYEGWKVDREDGDWAGHIQAANGEKVYHGAASFHAIPKKANALLMADAPALLLALETLTASVFSGDEARLMLVAFAGTRVSNEIHARCDAINAALVQARAAIAKARAE